MLGEDARVEHNADQLDDVYASVLARLDEMAPKRRPVNVQASSREGTVLVDDREGAEQTAGSDRVKIQPMWLAVLITSMILIGVAAGWCAYINGGGLPAAIATGSVAASACSQAMRHIFKSYKRSIGS
jgi:hypothetical protein